MYEQLDIFSLLGESKKAELNPGDWVEENTLGKELTFDEITKEIGNLIIKDCSTSSHKWYKVVRVEKIVTVENNTQRRLVYYDGTRQRGLVNEMCFDKSVRNYTAAYKIGGYND